MFPSECLPANSVPGPLNGVFFVFPHYFLQKHKLLSTRIKNIYTINVTNFIILFKYIVQCYTEVDQEYCELVFVNIQAFGQVENILLGLKDNEEDIYLKVDFRSSSLNKIEIYILNKKKYINISKILCN